MVFQLGNKVFRSRAEALRRLDSIRKDPHACMHEPLTGDDLSLVQACWELKPKYNICSYDFQFTRMRHPIFNNQICFAFITNSFQTVPFSVKECIYGSKKYSQHWQFSKVLQTYALDKKITLSNIQVINITNAFSQTSDQLEHVFLQDMFSNSKYVEFDFELVY